MPKRVLDIYRDEAGEWRWTLALAGRIIGASTESYKRRDGAERNIFSALGINLKATDWGRDDRIVRKGVVRRMLLSDNGRGLRGEIIDVTVWKKP